MRVFGRNAMTPGEVLAYPVILSIIGVIALVLLAGFVSFKIAQGVLWVIDTLEDMFA